MEIVRTPPTPHSLTTPGFRELTPRPKSPGVVSSNSTIKIEDLEAQKVEEISQKSEAMSQKSENQEIQVIHVKSEMLPKNENDMTMEDLESGLSIRDEDDPELEDTFKDDIEAGDIDAFVITKDALVSISKRLAFK